MKRLGLAAWAIGLLMTFASGYAGADGHKIIVVNTDTQTLSAWEDDDLVYEFHVVTGRPGKETTAGTFYTSRKYKDYTSRTYGVEMPYTMFFTVDGKAIHGTQMALVRSFMHAYLTESVGSQGCVGLANDEAAVLFDWAPSGTRIDVVDENMDD